MGADFQKLLSRLKPFFHCEGSVNADHRPPTAQAVEIALGIKWAPSRMPNFDKNAVEALRRLLKALAGPIKLIEEGGQFANPWTVAALRREEVRNARVLAWFLNPRSRHGCGDRLLTDLMRRVEGQLQFRLPDRPSEHCVVSVEVAPDGINANRVDIQIDDPNSFFTIIEVKIGAAEQPGQLARYCELARARSCDMRPWAVVFLTPDGRPPTTAGEHSGHIASLAWSTVATGLREAGRLPSMNTAATAATTRFLADTFAAHVSTF